MWKSKEIFIYNKVKDDPVSLNIVEQCPESRIIYTSSGKANDIKAESEVLRGKSSLIEQVIAGKDIVYVAPVGEDVFKFAVSEIRKYSEAPIALCKEATSVWNAVGLDAARNQCVCQWN